MSFSTFKQPCCVTAMLWKCTSQRSKAKKLVAGRLYFPPNHQRAVQGSSLQCCSSHCWASFYSLPSFSSKLETKQQKHLLCELILTNAAANCLSDLLENDKEVAARNMKTAENKSNNPTNHISCGRAWLTPQGSPPWRRYTIVLTQKHKLASSLQTAPVTFFFLFLFLPSMSFMYTTGNTKVSRITSCDLYVLHRLKEHLIRVWEESGPRPRGQNCGASSTKKDHVRKLSRKKTVISLCGKYKRRILKYERK